MFLCPTCHEQSSCKNGEIESLLPSRGQCELCGDVGSCLDCQGYKSSPKPAPVSEYPLSPRQIVEGGMAGVGYREMLDVARKLGVKGYEVMSTEQMKSACKAFVAEHPEEPGPVLRQVMEPEDAAMFERALHSANRDQIIVIGEMHSENAGLRTKVSRLEAQITAMQDAHIETIRLLRLAAEGRREYAAGGASSTHMLTDEQILRAEAQNFDSARKIVEGDTSPLYGLLPSWRWGEAGLS